MNKTYKILPGFSKISIIAVFVIMLIANCTSISQSITWQRNYDDPNHRQEGAYSLCPADGNNIYLAGYIGSIPTYGFIIKINAYGDTIWNKTLNQVSNIFSTIHLSDGSCIITGGGSSIFAAKILPTGQVNWLNYYGGQNSTQIIIKPNDGYIGCGLANNLSSYIYKIDSTGLLQWDKYYNSSYSVDFRSIVMSQTTGTLVCGSITDFPSDSGKGYLANISDSGNIIWEKRFNGKARSFEKIKILNNSYLIAGTKYDTAGTGYFRGFIMKTDLLGNQTFFKEINTTGSEAITDLLVLNSNKYIVVLKKYSLNLSTRILVLDSLGNELRELIVSDVRGSTSLNNITVAPGANTNDYVLAGSTTIVSTADDFYAIRIDSSLMNLPPFGIINLDNSVPTKTKLLQNFPNPFNPITKIEFQVSKASNIRIKLFNVLGKSIRDIFNGYKAHGTFYMEINCSELSSGIYFCSLYSNDLLSNTIKMIILK